jgi:hypothetical protein
MDSNDEKERRPKGRAGDTGTAAGDKPDGGDPYGYWDGPVYRHNYQGAVIWCRNMKLRGVSTGSRRPCTLGDCNADQIFLRWDDGDRSWPCIKALEQIGPNEFKYR